MDRIEEAIAKLTSTQLHLTATQNSLSVKLDDLLQKFAQMETNPYSPMLSTANQHIATQSSTLHRMKLEVPRFDGLDPMGWIFKITQFFKYHSTPDSERLMITSFYMDGSALVWYQWMTRNSQITSWSGLVQAHAMRLR